MLKVNKLWFYVCGYWRQLDDEQHEIEGTEFVKVTEYENATKIPLYQLRLKGYLLGTAPSKWQRIQMSTKGLSALHLINGFSVCGRKEQLEYLKAYIDESLKSTKIRMYGRKLVRLLFSRGYLNIGYAFGRRSVYAYVFSFNFDWFKEYSRLYKQLNEKPFERILPKIEEIYDSYKEERETYKNRKEKMLKELADKRLESALQEYEKENNTIDVEVLFDDFIDDLSTQMAEKIEENFSNVDLSIDVEI